jgi:hypothetical protein
LDKSVRVLAPAFFAPKGLWGLRHLTSDEILVAKDFSSDTVETFAGTTLSNALLAELVPGKCLIFGFRALINEGGNLKESTDVNSTKFTESAALGIAGFDATPTARVAESVESADPSDEEGADGDVIMSSLSNDMEATSIAGTGKVGDMGQNDFNDTSEMSSDIMDKKKKTVTKKGASGRFWRYFDRRYFGEAAGDHKGHAGAQGHQV